MPFIIDRSYNKCLSFVKEKINKKDRNNLFFLDSHSTSTIYSLMEEKRVAFKFGNEYGGHDETDVVMIGELWP